MADLIDWRHPALWAMADKLDFSTIPAFCEPHRLTPSEWDAYQADIVSAKHNAQAEKEGEQYTASFITIKEKGQLQRQEPLLGDKPVCIPALSKESNNNSNKSIPSTSHHNN